MRSVGRPQAGRSKATVARAVAERGAAIAPGATGTAAATVGPGAAFMPLSGALDGSRAAAGAARYGTMQGPARSATSIVAVSRSNRPRTTLWDDIPGAESIEERKTATGREAVAVH